MDADAEDEDEGGRNRITSYNFYTTRDVVSGVGEASFRSSWMGICLQETQPLGITIVTCAGKQLPYSENAKISRGEWDSRKNWFEKLKQLNGKPLE